MVPRAALLIVIALLPASCGQSTTAVTDPQAPSTTTTTVPATTTTTTTLPSTTTTVAGDGVLVTRCGAAVFTFGTNEPIGDPLDEEARAAFEEAGEGAAEEWFGEGSGFGGGWEWVLIERDDQHMVFFGTGPNGFADVTIEREGDRWDAARWGGCHFLTDSTLPGFGLAAWVTDPDSAPDLHSTSLEVWVMERACANGEPPVGREIRPVVASSEDAIEIVVLIKAVEGGANCPGNPWHRTTLEIGQPIGDRTLIDRHVSPGLVRPWPPTETSIQSWGDEE